MERAIEKGSFSDIAADDVTQAQRFRSRCWLAILYLAGAGGAISFISALILSLLTAVGLLEGKRSVGFAATGLIVLGLGAMVWAAHAMDCLAAIRIEE